MARSSVLRSLRLITVAVFAISSGTSAAEVECLEKDACACLESHGTACTLACDRANDCRSIQAEYVMTCASGDSCTAFCGGINSCLNARVLPNAATSVHVVCDGKKSCKNMEISCEASRPCLIECLDASSCSGLTVRNAETASAYECTGSQCPTTVTATATPTIGPEPSTTLVFVSPTLTVIASSSTSSTSVNKEQHVLEHTATSASNTPVATLNAQQQDQQWSVAIWIWICVAVGGSSLCCLPVIIICLICKPRQRNEIENANENNRLPLKQARPSLSRENQRLRDLVDGIQLTLDIADSGDSREPPRRLSDGGEESLSQVQLEGVIENQLNQDRDEDDASDENQRLNVVRDWDTTPYID